MIKSNQTIRYCQHYFNNSRGGGTLPSHTLDFHQHILGESRYFDSRPGRFVIAERLFIDAVDGCKVVHGLEEHLGKLGPGYLVRNEPDTLTVVFTTFPRSLPDASTMARRFLSACFACSSIPPATISPVAGSRGMFPETNRRFPNFMACEYGPTAPGASTAGFVRATQEGGRAHWK